MRRQRKLWRQRAEPAPLAEMNTTPLIDVMLVLLIMLILSIPVQLHAINLKLGAAPGPLTQPAPVRLVINAAGTVRWDAETVGEAELARRLSALAAEPNAPVLELRPDPDSPYELVATVLATIQRSGVNRLAVAGTP